MVILELNRSNVLKQIPGYERHYTPLSDYLLKVLQPKWMTRFSSARTMRPHSTPLRSTLRSVPRMLDCWPVKMRGDRSVGLVGSEDKTTRLWNE